MGAGPLLGEQLLAVVDPEAAQPFAPRLPNIGRGPHLLQMPAAGGLSQRISGAASPRSQQQGTALLRGRCIQESIDQRQRLTTDADFRWRVQGLPTTLWFSVNQTLAMSDLSTEAKEAAEAVGNAAEEAGADFNQRFAEVIGKVNETLDKLDWSQIGKVGKAAGILLAVIVAQILIKGVLDTINLLPIVPGLLELLGLVVVGTWSWDNLTTSEKRNAVVERLQGVRKEYLG